MWKEETDISRPDKLAIALSKAFNEAQVQEIIKGANDPKIKETLTRVTEKVARDLGAYGCPWFWVYDGKGNAEPFFGSDRFHYMWDYLDIPHEDLALHVQAKL
jgi:2-hydroxychromene-2-carboxylate isomerase